jgi:RES domain-containing protein
LTPLPSFAAGKPWTVWRLENARYAPEWHKAEGAFRFGGRWNSPGTRILYTSIDPATTVLEAAVHKGFNALDTVPHALLRITISDVTRAHVVQPEDVPNPHWLRPGAVSTHQQAFADALLAEHPIVLIPSVVSSHSWNVLIDAVAAARLLSKTLEERFALDPRLAPGASPSPRTPRAA